MENPLKILREKIYRHIDSRDLNDAELSQLLVDVEKVWMREEIPEGGYQLIENLRELPEQDAALVLTTLLTPYLYLSLKERLEAIGIAVGELTPDRSTPTGVRGMLRSGSPILLMTNDMPEDSHRPIEIARSIGEMIYGYNDESILKFVKAFNADLALSDSIDIKAVE